VITRETLAARLEETGLAAVTLSGPGTGWALLVPGLGAKVLGAGVDEENLFWVPAAVSAGEWCVGGQRTWLAPELGARGFLGRGESDWQVPPALDPGSYTLGPRGYAYRF
jgi:hypothetical protein